MSLKEKVGQLVMVGLDGYDEHKLSKAHSRLSCRRVRFIKEER